MRILNITHTSPKSGSTQRALLAVVLTLSLLLAACAGRPARRAPEPTAEALEREQKALAALDAAGSQTDRLIACRELRQVATPRSIPALAAMLRDEQTANYARYALEPMPYGEADQALCNALGDTTGETQLSIIHSIGFRRDPRSVGALLDVLDAGDDRAKRAVLFALGDIASRRAVRVIGKHLESPNESLRSAAAEAQLIAAQHLEQAGRSRSASRLYEGLLAGDWPDRIRDGAFIGAIATDPRGSVTRILETFEAGDPALRRVAIAAVPRLEDAEAIDRLVEQLPELADSAKVLLIEAFADVDHPGVAEAVTETLAAGTSSEVRCAAAGTLGRIGGAEAVEPLCATFADAPKDSPVSEAVVAALTRLNAAGVDRAIASQLGDHGPAPLRIALMGVLATRNASGVSRELLGEAIVPPNAEVRTAALDALARIGEPGYLPTLVKRLVEAPDDPAAPAARAAIVQIARRIEEPRERITALEQAWNDAPAEARVALVQVAGNIPGAPALAFVRGALDSEDAAVQDAAVRALTEWPEPEALSDIMKVFRESDEPLHRVLALRGAARLIPKADLAAEAKLGIYRELLAAAEEPGEQRLVIGAIGALDEPAALATLQPYMSDPETRAEAQTAACDVVRRVASAAPDRAAATLERIAQEPATEAIAATVSELQNYLAELASYVVDWRIAGPYREEGAQGPALYDKVFAPETDPGSVEWRPLPVNSESERPWVMDLAAAIGGSHCVGYARTWIHSDRNRTVKALLGVDDGIKVWLGDDEVHGNNSAGVTVPGEETFEIELRAGWNPLLLKVIQHTGPWDFCLRLADEDGAAAKGLRVRSSSPER